MYYIMAITVKRQNVNCLKVQEVFHDYGDIIRARLGLAETTEERKEGLIILHLKVSAKANTLAKKLNALPGVNAELMKIK